MAKLIFYCIYKKNTIFYNTTEDNGLNKKFNHISKQTLHYIIYFFLILFGVNYLH